jgi:predicted nucleic acid-binding Zn ribbon protein
MFLNPLESIFNQVIQQPEWQKYREYIQIIECWQQVVNQQVFHNTKPLYQEREILYVATSSAVWAQELALQRYSLVKKLNSRLNFKIKDIRFSPASWYQKPKQKIVEILLQEVSKQKTKTETESNISANTAVASWLNKIPKKSPNLVNCPQCQSLTPQAELTRWQVCRYCIAQKWHNEYRPPT